MKAYLIVHDSYGYEGEYGKVEVDSVFLDKEKAEAYVERNNQIPFCGIAEFYIEEVEFEPSDYDKQIVEIEGSITKDKKFEYFAIIRIDREDMEELKDFTGEEITFNTRKVDLLMGKATYVTDFDGTIDVTPCKDLKKCDEYIKEIVMKKYCEYKNEMEDN